MSCRVQCLRLGQQETALLRFTWPARWVGAMVRVVAVEVLALASVSLFVAMVAVWAQVLSVV